MSYNPFRWYTKGKKKRLPQSAHLFDRIQNGDFDYSHYYTEAEAARSRAAAIIHPASAAAEYPLAEQPWGRQ